MTTLAWMPHGFEWIALLALGLLLFGRRLPEVGRSLGQGLVEFKRGLKGVTDEVEEESSKPAPLPKATKPALSAGAPAGGGGGGVVLDQGGAAKPDLRVSRADAVE